MRLEGKCAIVTGGAGSIGSAIATRLAQEGCAVALIDRDPSTETAQKIGALGLKAFDHPADVADTNSLQRAFSAAAIDLGGLDILVTAAGITSFGSAADLSEAEWDRVLAINLKGVFFSCQAAILHLKRRGGGRIVNIGSVLAKNGGNARPWIDEAEQSRAANVAYGASKAGVHALTLYLAKELAAHRITVNAVAPGPIASAMSADFPATLRTLIPVGRLGTSDEVAAAVSYLVSDEAGFVTGEILDLNGGIWTD